MGKRQLDDLLCLSSWCLVMVVWLFPAVPWVCLQFVMVVFFLNILTIFSALLLFDSFNLFHFNGFPMHVNRIRMECLFCIVMGHRYDAFLN